MALFDFEKLIAANPKDESEHLLQVSEFLNQFQHFFRCDDGPSWEITIDDVRKVYTHRKSLEEVGEVDVTKDALRLQDRLHRDRATVESTKALHLLLRRFEVWTTKALVQHLLFSDDGGSQDANEATGGLLGLPRIGQSLPLITGATDNRPMHRFGKAWEKCYGKKAEHQRQVLNLAESDGSDQEARDPVSGGSQGALAVGDACVPEDSGTKDSSSIYTLFNLSIPPNEYTWHEYFRLVSMVGLLHEECRQCAQRSRFAGSEAIHRDILQSKNLCSPADLVALWIRAQRSFQALRHLVQLFQVERLEDGRGYVASFLGPHALLGRKVLKESKRIEKFVHWAVVNQTLRTQNAVQIALTHPYRRKRKFQEPSVAASAKQSELDLRSELKRDADNGIGMDLKEELLHASQRFILRSFAFRHRRELEILFFSNADEARAATAYIHVQERTIERLDLNVHMKIKASLVKSSDRTMTRIDRRILTGKFAEFDEKEGIPRNGAKDKFHEAIQALLIAAGKALAQMGDDREVYADIQRDIDKSYAAFWDRKEKMGIIGAARSLLDGHTLPEDLNADRLYQFLLDFPAPWIERCSICESSPFQGDCMLVCSGCGCVAHEHCLPKENQRRTFNVRSFVQSYDPLREMFMPRLPSRLSPPDFRKDSQSNPEITWETKIVRLKRKLSSRGFLQPVGLNVIDSRVCEKTLDNVLSKSADLTCLFGEFEYPPIATPYQGLVVTGFQKDGGACQPGGDVRVSDVITAIEIVELVDDQGREAKFASSKVHDLHKLSECDRLHLLELPWIEVKCILQRPNTDTVGRAYEWFEHARAMNLGKKKSIDLAGTLWLCRKCRQMADSPELGRTLLESGICKALIRRLSISHYDLLDLDEGGSGGEGVTLRLLDSMMTWIQYEFSRREGVMFDCSGLEKSPFWVGGKRLSWASEEMESLPYVLLCRGIEKMVSNALTRDETQRSTVPSFIADFVRLFCAWCLSSDHDSKLPIASRGPPPGSFHIAFPNSERHCTSCQVQQVKPTSGDDYQCNKTGKHDLDSSGASPDEEQVLAERYLKCSSLVGKTLFLLPSDPLVASTLNLLQTLGVQIEHNERPVEFLVASFLPRGTNKEKNGVDPVMSGTFHVIPLLNPTQVDFLLGQRQLREPSMNLSDDDIMQWRNDGLLDLDGVINVSYTDLLVKLKESFDILQAISEEVSCQAKNATRHTVLDVNNKAVKSQSSSCLVSQVFSWSPESHSRLIEAALRAMSPVLLEMLGSSEDSSLCSEHHDDDRILRVDTSFVEGPSFRSTMRSTSKECRVLFSDIMSTDAAVVHDFCSSNKIVRQSTARKDKFCALVYTANDVSFRTDELCSFWGFEICLWDGETRLKVGRVLTNSHAARAGLCSGDHLFSINGEKVDYTSTTSFLYQALLSLHVSDAHSKSVDRALSIAACNPVATVGPIVLRINHVPLETNVQTAPCQRSINPASNAGNAKVVESCPEQGGSQNGAAVSTAVAKNPIAANPSASSNQLRSAHTPVDKIRLGPTFSYKSVRHLVEKIRILYRGRLQATTEHLYRPGYPSTCLSLMETSLFMLAGVKGYVMLGFRMLMPRYEINLLLRELERLADVKDMSGLPHLSERAWNLIVKRDLARYQTEPADEPVRLFDERHSYRFPKARFPIDRMLESILAPDSIERIRGGGLEQMSVLEVLSNIPRKEWADTLVVGKCKTTISGDDQGEAEVIGHVVSMTGDKIGIRVIYISSRGVIEPVNLGEIFHASDLTLIQPNTTEFVNAEEFVKVVKDKKNRSTYTLDQRGHGNVKYVVLTSADGAYKSASNSHDALDGESQTKDPSQQHTVEQEVMTIADTAATNVTTYSVEEGEAQIQAVASVVLTNGLQNREANRDVSRFEHGSMSNQNASDQRWKDVPTAAQGHAPETLGFGMGVSEWTEPDKARPDIRRVQQNGSAQSDNIAPICMDDISHNDSSPIGVLPDGRQVFWFVSDPKSLYVSTVLLNKGTIKAHKTCVWGCSESLAAGGRQPKPLAFDKFSDLISHLQADYSFGAGVDVFSREGGLVRVPEGAQIKTLMYGLTASACAAEPVMMKWTVPGGTSLKRGATGKYFSSPTSTQIMFQVDTETAQRWLRTSKGLDPKAVSTFRMWMRISALFDTDGMFCSSSQDKPLPSLLQGVVHGGASTFFSTSSLTATELSWGTSPPDGLHHFGRAKHILLTLQEKVPKFVNDGTTFDERVASTLWENNAVEMWRRFVDESRSWKSLAQAFAVLVGAVDLSRMPKWWSGDGIGWNSIQTLMSIQSLSGLLLHLYVFDAAIEEYTSNSLSSTFTFPQREIPGALKGMTYENVTEVVSELLGKHEIVMFEGNNGEYCCVCGDGGDLLCCELCANVQHAACVEPKPNGAPSRFFCNPCIADLLLLE